MQSPTLKILHEKITGLELEMEQKEALLDLIKVADKEILKKDFMVSRTNKDKEIARLEAAYTFNVEKAGARIIKTRATFEDAHTLRLSKIGRAHV